METNLSAKEIKQKHLRTLESGKLEPWMEFTEIQFNKFCEQLCKEQREICAKAYGDNLRNKTTYFYQVAPVIKNAKTPEL